MNKLSMYNEIKELRDEELKKLRRFESFNNKKSYRIVNRFGFPMVHEAEYSDMWPYSYSCSLTHNDDFPEHPLFPLHHRKINELFCSIRLDKDGEKRFREAFNKNMPRVNSSHSEEFQREIFLSFEWKGKSQETLLAVARKFEVFVQNIFVDPYRYIKNMATLMRGTEFEYSLDTTIYWLDRSDKPKKKGARK